MKTKKLNWFAYLKQLTVFGLKCLSKLWSRANIFHNTFHVKRQWKFTMPVSPRTLFMLHFSWVSKWFWKTLTVKQSWKISNDLGVRQSINILNMKHSGMIKLELHVSLQKEVISTLQIKMFSKIKRCKLTSWRKYSWSEIKNHNCGELLNPVPQICYILLLESSASKQVNN